MGNTISNAGASANSLLRQLGNSVEQGARALQDGVNSAEQVVGQYVEDRGERLEGIGNKISQGHIVDAAMDAFQAISLGGGVSDAAHALGLVESPADRALLSGVVNAMTGNFIAAAGDGEDFLQNMQPRFQHAQRTIDSMDISFDASASGNVEMAGSHYVPGPMTQLRANINANLHVSVRQSEDPRPANGGYAGGRLRGNINFSAVRARLAASGRFELNFSASLSSRSGRMPTVVTARFAQALPNLTAHFAAPMTMQATSRPQMPHMPGMPNTQTGGAGQTSASQASGSTTASSASGANQATGSTQASEEKPGISNEAMHNMLSDPSLSFEDKLFMFMLAMAKNQEAKLENLMGRYSAAKEAKENKENGKPGKTDGKTEAEAAGTSQQAASTSSASAAGQSQGAQASSLQLPEFGTTASGKQYPKGGKNDSMLGGIVDMVKGFDAGVVRMIGQAAPMAAPALGSAIGAALGSVFPGLGTAIGGMVGGMLGDMLAKDLIPQACEQIAKGIESGDFDWYFKGAVVANANMISPLLGTALAVEDSGAMGLLGPAGVAANELGKGQSASKGGKSPKAKKHAAKHKARSEAKQKAKAAAHNKAKEAAHANKSKASEDKGVGVTGGNVPKGSEKLNSASSDQEWMMHLQKAQQDMSKMYQMLSNTMKSMHDTQMTAVRNLR